jgi:hypothetical protein
MNDDFWISPAGDILDYERKNGLRIQREANARNFLQALGLLQAFDRADGGSIKSRLEMFDKSLWMALEQEEFRGSDDFKRALHLRTSLASDLSDFRFFIRLGRALEKKPQIKIVPRNWVADLLVSLWLDPLKEGGPALCQLTDAAITEFVSYFARVNKRHCGVCTEARIRKLRQRLHLVRPSAPRFKRFRATKERWEFS